ncbi:sugar phosphate isomerase/epimerase family protein [Salinisphaera sp. RV14]|uniref:sugar phosphate isomerase/epimerase family protein n=1 Tax=Salinisphaera sp. RV14 TaxID=3454140 RepID=UPI003F84A795
MAIGLSTYAFTWRGSQRMASPMTLADMMDETVALGGGVFQICDHPAIEALSDAELAELAAHAARHDLTLELGTRGIGPTQLARYLDIAARLDVRVLRSMFNDAETRPTPDQVQAWLRAFIPRLERQDVRLALETYEQVPVDTLVATVGALDSPHVGICLDPGNCVAALEMPASVVERTAPYVANLHIKDFKFTRADSWVGFRLLGCPLGEGLLDLDGMLARVAPRERGINCIVEHWLDWQNDAATTAATEAAWTRHSMDILRSLQS